MRKISKSNGLNNGVMLRFPPGSSVTVRVRPHNVLGVELEVGVEKSKNRVAAIFLLPVWPLAPCGWAFSSYFGVYGRRLACSGSGISLRPQARLRNTTSGSIKLEVVIEMLVFAIFLPLRAPIYLHCCPVSQLRPSRESDHAKCGRLYLYESEFYICCA